MEHEPRDAPRPEAHDFPPGMRSAIPNFAWLGAGVTIVLQIVALVWGAAKMSSSVEQLTLSVTESRGALRELNNRLSDVQLQVTELKTQFQDRNQWMTSPPAWYSQPPHARQP